MLLDLVDGLPGGRPFAGRKTSELLELLGQETFLPFRCPYCGRYAREILPPRAGCLRGIR